MGAAAMPSTAWAWSTAEQCPCGARPDQTVVIGGSTYRLRFMHGAGCVTVWPGLAPSTWSVDPSTEMWRPCCPVQREARFAIVGGLRRRVTLFHNVHCPVLEEST
jgi:hypothetical protein